MPALPSLVVMTTAGGSVVPVAIWLAVKPRIELGLGAVFVLPVWVLPEFATQSAMGPLAGAVDFEHAASASAALTPSAIAAATAIRSGTDAVRRAFHHMFANTPKGPGSLTGSAVTGGRSLPRGPGE